jgi:hypothetical protein
MGVPQKVFFVRDTGNSGRCGRVIETLIMLRKNKHNDKTR